MSRRSRVIDTSAFQGLVAEALTAYQADPSYAVAMARQATTIQNKRDVWALRIELRQAEQEATALCSNAEPFVCSNAGPCGVGSECKFASGDLALLQIQPPASGAPRRPGRSMRPMPSEHDRMYSIEEAVRPLQAQRASSA